MTKRNPHYCDLSPWDPDYREPGDCPGCDRDRWLEAEEDVFDRAEREEIGW